MRFPDDLWGLILTYKYDFERRAKYDKILSVFAAAITHKPDLVMITGKEARQTFVRLFPQYRDHLRLIATDLVQYMGPPVDFGVGSQSVWFMLEKTSLSFPPLDPSPDEEAPQSPGRVL